MITTMNSLVKSKDGQHCLPYDKHFWAMGNRSYVREPPNNILNKQSLERLVLLMMEVDKKEKNPEYFWSHTKLMSLWNQYI